MLPLCLYLLLLHRQLVLQCSDPSFQLHNPPLGLYMTRDKASVTLLYLCPKLELLMGNCLHSCLCWLVLCPHSDGPMKFWSIHIKCTLWRLSCQPFPVTGLDNYGGG